MAIRFQRLRPLVRAVKWLLAGIAGIVLLGLVVWAVWRIPQLLYAYVPDAKDRAAVEATTRTGLIAGLAGLAALGSLALSNRTYRLSQQGQLTDRYTKAIEQLGDDKLDIRLGGLYALERLAVDSKRDHPTVVEVLSAFVRERTHSRRAASPFPLTNRSSEQARQPEPPTVDVQAALTILGRLPHRAGISRGDLAFAYLASVNLNQADLSGANLRGTNLMFADLREAELTNAMLEKSVLKSAQLDYAKLLSADLVDADLSGAGLYQANFAGATLGGADLTEAFLLGTNLTRTNLLYTKLSQNQLDEATGDGRTLLPEGLQPPKSWTGGSPT